MTRKKHPKTAREETQGTPYDLVIEGNLKESGED